MVKQGESPSQQDKVVWRSHGAEVPGTVGKKITERTEAAGREIADDPRHPAPAEEPERER